MAQHLPAGELSEFIVKLPVFERLTKTECHGLLSQCRLHALDQREVMQAAGETHHHLWVIVTGEIAMVANSEDGDELTLAIFGPGSTSSWIALFHDTPAERNLVGGADSHILGIPRKLALELLETHPTLYPVVLKIEATRFRAALNLQQHNLVRERPRRVAGLLLMLMEMSGGAHHSRTIRLTSQQLAKMAHCSRQSLFQAVKILSGHGAVSQRYGEIVITDVEKLQALYQGAQT
jgi:CRP-like cAMP-binding protein